MQEAITAVICLDHASLKGGQERVAFDSAIGLKALGHRPIIFASAGPVAPMLIDAGIEVVCLDQRELGKNSSRVAAAAQGLWNTQAAQALQNVLDGLPRDRTIVHVHGWAGALSPSIFGPIAKSGLPAVFTVHDYYQFCPNGGFYNYAEQHVCTLKPLSTACWATNCDQRNYARKLWRNVRLLMANRIAALPKVFKDYITISDLQRSVVAPLVAPNVMLHSVPNPVSVPDLGPRPGPGDAFIYVGRLSPEKGPLLFAEAAKRAGVTATFMGEGPLADELAERFPDARQLGWCDQATVQRTMREARALVFPSVWYEGQPLTVLEAKGLGLPVIVSDACSGRESVENGVTGLWFKSEDIDDLAKALNTMRDDAIVRAMSDASYKAYWASPPTIDAHVARLTGVYRAVIDRTVQRAQDATTIGRSPSPARRHASHA